MAGHASTAGEDRAWGLVRWATRTAALAAVPAAAFALGFAAETTSLFDRFLLGVVTVIVPLLLFLIAALATSVGERGGFVTGLVLGVVAGCVAGILFVIGVFSPFALELGERDLNDFGGPDLRWNTTLAWGSVIWAAGGAALGATCGIAAWALRLGLGRKRTRA